MIGVRKGNPMKDRLKLDGKKGFIIVIILLILVIGYYFYLSNRDVEPKEEDIKLTEAQELLLRDLDRNYPPTPKEVVKYYFEITKCLYNEELSESLAELDIEYDTMKCMYDTLLEELRAQQESEKTATSTAAQDTGMLNAG